MVGVAPVPALTLVVVQVDLPVSKSYQAILVGCLWWNFTACKICSFW